MVTLVVGYEPDETLAEDIFRFTRERLAPFKRIRRLQFGELPKTISGKIRRVDLRRQEQELRGLGGRAPQEYWEDDFPSLKAS